MARRKPGPPIRTTSTGAGSSVGMSVAQAISGSTARATGSAQAQAVAQASPPEPPLISGSVYPTDYSVPAYGELTFSDTNTALIHRTQATYQMWKGFPGGQNQTQVIVPGVYCDNLMWKNIGGDWLDASTPQVAQGSVPFQQYTVNNTGVARWIDWDVTALVQKWVGGAKNYGFFLRSLSGTCNVGFNTRFSASNTPILRLTIGGNSVDVPCDLSHGRSQWLNQSFSLISKSTTAHVNGTTDYFLLWFDLSAYSSGITAAHLLAWTYGQSGGASANVGVFEISNPGDQTTMPAQELGVAAKYAYDSGLENDDAILFAEQFADANYPTRFTSFGGTHNYWITAADAYGFTLLAGKLNGLAVNIVANTQGESQLNAIWSPWYAGAGRHVKAIDPAGYKELYFRFYVMFGNDFLPSPEGGKFPGFDGRYGGWNRTGGGSVIGAIAGMGNANGGTGCDGYVGWSDRSNWDDAGSADYTLSPTSGGQWINHYDVYNIDQAGEIAGNAKSYGNGDTWDRKYLGWLRRGQWYCVEEYFKRNTVTTRPRQKILSITSIAHPTIPNARLATATIQTDANYPNGDLLMQSDDYKFITGAVPDAYNNPRSTTQGVADYSAARITVVNDGTHTKFTYTVGTSTVLADADCTNCYAEHNIPNRDGITRTWVNGFLAHERTDWAFVASELCRDGVTPYGISAIWMNIWQGGVGTILNDCHLYFGAVAVGTQYIGPMGVAPAWLAGKAANTWIQIANTALAAQTRGMDKLVARGLCAPATASIPYGSVHPPWTENDGSANNLTPGRQHIMDYSGGALRASDSTFIIFGGGAAGGWPGNDIRGIKLEDDAPAWDVLSPANQITDAYQLWSRINTTVMGIGTQTLYNGGVGSWPSGSYPAYNHSGTPATRKTDGSVDSYTGAAATDPLAAPPTTNSGSVDGLPISRHSYKSVYYRATDNALWIFGETNNWPDDAGAKWFDTTHGPPIDRFSFAANAWDAPYAHGTFPTTTAGSNMFGLRFMHPTTERLYICWNSAVLWEFDPSSATWRIIVNRANQPAASSGMAYAIGAVDPKRNKILFLGYYSGGAAPINATIDLNTPHGSDGGTWTTAILSGPYASTLIGPTQIVGPLRTGNIGLSQPGANAIPNPVYDPNLDKFLIFLDDGYLYTITYVSDAEWSVDRLAITNGGVVGQSPVVGGSEQHTSAYIGIWSRFQYVPNLKGVVVCQAYDQNLWFVRTA